MDWFEGCLKVFYAVPLRARACIGLACMVALVWLPLALGLLRAFVEHPCMATVQQCYRDWWKCTASLCAHVLHGEQGA